MNEHDPESWRPCRAGEFAEIGNNLVLLRRRRLAMQTVSSLCGVFLVIGIVLWLGPVNDLPVYATITCSECHSQMSAYQAQTLSPSQMQQMDAHFGHCPGCKDRYEKLKECHDRKACDADDCDVSRDCKASDKCKVSNCMSWNCQAKTCQSSHDCEAKSSTDCERKPL
ncbi:anti-sigma factor family protein [Blastopirellula marina]|uniref:Putative zinc-finger domain-containing protein n=1 Tax=Blastopirellula marina TaxID=124 RepID=A0A2S8F3V7_9BACT|nr:zf-HC2 domain-containing protein [Blastopirellula marina]PQO26839.1 hypothetical protein C5Y98_29140 [Blastopirellula marina]PQO41528.1 hypothetical protein C5Y93_30940 [Blastopirellula marina]PTL41046.1 zf-HC2 domain-containing protein [Blastopirellula marina]